ncbi:MAG TPA: 4,5-DOPA dioxygenase extradiol [Thermohalobaculum sp.]|nr:4,5-DOPA dioxygenase extradiol [Thermohalobaculum sp.]
MDPMPAISSQLRPSSRMPALFVGHGNPMHAIVDSEFSRGWAEIGEALPPPAAILCVSAHWMTRGTTLVQVSAKPETIHDFGGFPQKLFDQQYPAPGAPALAAETAELLAKHHATTSDEWGLDHGAWAVLIRMFPKADVPVYQLSLDLSRPVRAHYELARDLKALRERGVLIVGSGNIVHNLPAMRRGGAPYDWAVEFDAMMAEAIAGRRFGAVAEAEGMGNLMQTAHPTVEHFLPLLYTLGVADEADEISFFNEGIDLGSVSMRSCLLA